MQRLYDNDLKQFASGFKTAVSGCGDRKVFVWKVFVDDEAFRQHNGLCIS